MDKKTILTLAAGVVLGMVLAPKLGTLPLLNRLPKA